jgi:hypothetical protein
MLRNDGEIHDLPFANGNDMNNSPSTMGKPLDPADGPGKADAEMAESDELMDAPKPPSAAGAR